MRTPSAARFGLILFSVLIGSTPTHADSQIGDPPPVHYKKIVYNVHENKISASLSGVVLWETVLPYAVEPKKLKPNLERDVQLCLSRILTVNSKIVTAEDCKHRRYRLSAKSGNLIKKRTPVKKRAS